ncbi:hypothetical protein KR018_004408, partial [Drosophila ironensis]
NAGASAARKARISGVEPHEESPEGAAASEKPENPEDDLISKETLRESPVQWPERFPGIAEFMNLSETPLYMTFSELGQCITEEETAKINKLAKMTPEQLVERIKTMHDEIYQLGLREAKEMTRGKLLGIFAPERLPNPRWSDY